MVKAIYHTRSVCRPIPAMYRKLPQSGNELHHTNWLHMYSDVAIVAVDCRNVGKKKSKHKGCGRCGIPTRGCCSARRLQQNRRLPYPSPLLFHCQDRDQRLNVLVIMSSGGKRGTKSKDAVNTSRRHVQAA